MEESVYCIQRFRLHCPFVLQQLCPAAVGIVEALQIVQLILLPYNGFRWVLSAAGKKLFSNCCAVCSRGWQVLLVLVLRSWLGDTGAVSGCESGKVVDVVGSLTLTE